MKQVRLMAASCFLSLVVSACATAQAEAETKKCPDERVIPVTDSCHMASAFSAPAAKT